MAIYATALAMAFIMLMVPNVSAAGAAASLIFLVSFALVHWTALLARRRSRVEAPFRTPYFPAVPLIGGLACASLAAYQAIVVPGAGFEAALSSDFIVAERDAARAGGVGAERRRERPGGELWHYDALRGALRKTFVRQRGDCPLCNGEIQDLRVERYTAACAA